MEFDIENKCPVNESDVLDNFLRDSKASLYSQESSVNGRSTEKILRMANQKTVQEEIEFRGSSHLEFIENERF